MYRANITFRELFLILTNYKSQIIYCSLYKNYNKYLKTFAFNAAYSQICALARPLKEA